MSITIATGTLIAVASTYGSVVNMTAITNASEAVATLAVGHGVVVGDFLEVTSGWDLLNGKIVRVKTVATNDITFETINTTSTSSYPVGTGTGTIRRITAWTNVTQVQGIDTGGGEQNYADITAVTDRTQKQVPTTRNAQAINLTVFDDPAQSYYAVVVAAADSSSTIGLRIIFPNASRLVCNGYISLQKTPKVASNQPLTADINFSSFSEPVRYAT
jgi:hypothetical protein